MGNQSTMMLISSTQDDICNWEFVNQSDFDDCDAFEVQSFDLADSLHSLSDHDDDVATQVEGMVEETGPIGGPTDDVGAHLVDLVETVLENDKDETFVAQTHVGCEKGEGFGAHNHMGSEKGGSFGALTHMGCGKGEDFWAHNGMGDDKGGNFGNNGSHNDHGSWTLDENLMDFVGGLTVESHGYQHGDGEEVEEEEEDEGYGVDDELVPWDVKDVFVRQRIRKSGKKSLSRNMIKTKKSAVIFTRPGCVRGKYALGLKAY